MTDARLSLRPISRKEARLFVARHHSHNKPPSSSIFQVGVESDGELVGVAIVGIPNARHLMDGVTCEVTRVCTIGTRNAASMLYGATTRAAKALGYKRAVTYTLEHEAAAALRACGWKADDALRDHDPHGWQRQRHRRGQTVTLFGEVVVPEQRKRRWWKDLSA